MIHSYRTTDINTVVSIIPNLLIHEQCALGAILAEITCLEDIVMNGNCAYKVISRYTLDEGFTSMIFISTPTGEVINLHEIDCVRYDNYEEMIAGHEEIKNMRKCFYSLLTIVKHYG